MLIYHILAVHGLLHDSDYAYYYVITTKQYPNPVEEEKHQHTRHILPLQGLEVALSGNPLIQSIFYIRLTARIPTNPINIPRTTWAQTTSG